MALNLIDQFRGFMRTAIAEQLTVNERCLYITLLWYWNELARPEWFTLTDAQLESLSGVNKKTVSNIRNKFRQNGLLEVKAGKKKTPTQYKLTEVFCLIGTLKMAQEWRSDGAVMAQEWRSDGAVMVSLNREEKSKEENNNNPDLLTNDLLTNSRELTPAEEQVKSAFESTFHPLTKLDELDMLKAYTGDYGAKAVLRAIKAADKAKRETWDRERLSPAYLLPILRQAEEQQTQQEQQTAPKEPPPNPWWTPRKRTPEEIEFERKLGEKYKAMEIKR